MFNRLPKHVRMLSSMEIFKSQLDDYVRSIADLPCQPGLNNSLNGEDCINGGHHTFILEHVSEIMAAMKY